MKLYGLALIPEKDFCKKIVKWRLQINQHLAPPVLGLNENLPHCSILQCPFDPKALTQKTLLKIIGVLEKNIKQSHKISSIYYQPSQWVFLDFSDKEYLFKYQDKAFQCLKEFINTENIKKKSDYSGYTHLEVGNYEKWGYRYIGEAFLPHITLGCTKNEQSKIEEVLIKSFNENILGIQFKFSEIVFYEAGQKGALKKILAKYTL